MSCKKRKDKIMCIVHAFTTMLTSVQGIMGVRGLGKQFLHFCLKLPIGFKCSNQ